MLHRRMNTRSPEREKEQPIRTRRRCRGAQASFPWRQKQTGALEEWCLRAARSGRVIFTSHQEQTSPEPEPGAPGASNRRKPAAEPPAPTMASVDYPAQNSTTSSSSPHHKVNTHTHTHLGRQHWNWREAAVEPRCRTGVLAGLWSTSASQGLASPAAQMAAYSSDIIMVCSLKRYPPPHHHHLAPPLDPPLTDSGPPLAPCLPLLSQRHGICTAEENAS